MKQLIECRDFFYIKIKNRYNEKIARHDVGNMMIMLLSFYYGAFIIFIAMLQYKSRIAVPAYLKNNLIVEIIGGLILLTPFYYLQKFIMNKLSVIPIDENMTTAKQKIVCVKVVLIFVSGFLLAILVGWSMQEFMPFLR